MRFTRIRLENWRNFAQVDVPLEQRVFLVGPNASGKSNFLDAFRFLRDIVTRGLAPEGAVKARGGVSRIRSLDAPAGAPVAIEVDVDLGHAGAWGYRLELVEDAAGQPRVHLERVRHDQEVLVERPDDEDREDEVRTTRTVLEQVTANRRFRKVAELFASVRYLHIVPQLVREPDRSVGRVDDPFGGDFLEQMARTPESEREHALEAINEALRVAVPHLERLEPYRDERGVFHLRSVFGSTAPASWQNEAQLSDGTLRLLGLLWVLMAGNAPVLLEEPELSLHAAVVRRLAPLMARLGRRNGIQVIVSTHSADLLSDPGIAPEEVLMLVPAGRGTEIQLAAGDEEIRGLLDGDMSIGEAVLPRIAPADAERLALVGD